MNFSQALELLDSYKTVRRRAYEKFYFFKRNKVNGLIELYRGSHVYKSDKVFSSRDFLGDDWEEVKDEQ